MTDAVATAPAGATIPAVATRYGLKGNDAASWLEARGVAVPQAPNRASHWPQGRCLRLGSSEFLVEHDDCGVRPPAGDEPAQAGAARAWVLLRSDHSLLLDAAWPPRLAHACSFDFERFRSEPDLVVMTLLAGIGVILVREPAPGAGLSLRLWCDASYATFLDHVLHQLAALPAAGDSR